MVNLVWIEMELRGAPDPSKAAISASAGISGTESQPSPAGACWAGPWLLQDCLSSGERS